MSVGEIALLIGLLINAGAVYYGMRRSGIQMDRVETDIHAVEVATNSMKDALVEASEKAAHAAGHKEARIEGEKLASQVRARRSTK